MALEWPLEQEGSRGENVRSIQYLLNQRGSTLDVDGIFGPLTEAAVRQFQAANDLGVDGKVGDETWPVLIIEVSDGSTGDAVRAVQSQIHARSQWLTIDGIFGSETLLTVRDFQQFCALSVDGIVGPNTWNALVSPYLRAPGGALTAQQVYDAWTRDDAAAARYEATAAAVEALFARTWHSSDGWTFGNCDVAAGTFGCSWNRPAEQLLLEGNDSTGAPFYFVHTVTFQAT